MTTLDLMFSSLAATDAISVWTWCLEDTTPRLTYNNSAEVFDCAGLGND